MSALPRRVQLDFVAGSGRARAAGALLCASGLAAALAVGLSFSGVLAERQQLEDAQAATARPRQRAPSPESVKDAAEAAVMERELGVPWTRLLGELESAAHDATSRVSLLEVEPDLGKHQVRITAEVRTLEDAFDYLQRLQQCETLRYPMLESHERRKDDRQHPLRIHIAAEWRT
jgi:hypothetical protein